MNFAGIHRLPVVFILENNRFAYSTPNELEFAVDPVERAHTYGFPGVNVDGNDVEEVFEAAREAADLARAGGGPTLIECQTMRMHGHGAHDDMRYVPKELRDEWERRDPIDRYAERLVADFGFRAEEFGADRCLDAPLAENAIIGTAVGAAVEGLKPVCEMQFADFISCGFDQLVNVAAKLHYRQGIAVPMVVRLPSGGGFSGGPFHS